MVSADHGPAVSGAHNTIVTARAGKDLVSSLTSGLLTIVSAAVSLSMSPLPPLFVTTRGIDLVGPWMEPLNSSQKHMSQV